MNITLLPSSLGTAAGPMQFLTSYRVNRSVAIDAGSLGICGTPEEQAQVRHIFLTHSHIDHLATLPIFLENTARLEGPPVTVHATAPVLDALRRDVFNDRLWPDLFRLATPERSFLAVRELTPGETVAVDGLRLTPIPMEHVVPAVGFLVEDDEAAVVVAADTGPTEAIWRRAARLERLRAVFLEVTFPNELDWLAELAQHLTPARFAAETAKLARPTRWLVTHVKPRLRAAVLEQLRALALPGVELAEPGREYRFGQPAA